jgi:hypothetical protein
MEKFNQLNINDENPSPVGRRTRQQRPQSYLTTNNVPITTPIVTSSQNQTIQSTLTSISSSEISIENVEKI